MTAGDMFQRKIDNILKKLPNVFGIADDILVIGYDDGGLDYDNTLRRVLLMYQNVNLKLHNANVIIGFHQSDSLVRSFLCML